MLKQFFVLIIAALLGGFIGCYIQSHLTSDTNPNQQYYSNAASTLVSPHHLRGEMDKGHTDYILVDLRTTPEYEEEHIIGAVNVDASLSKEEIVSAFNKLQLENEEIIIYCYSSACLTGRKVGAMLASEEIYVKELSVGWNEWRYDFKSWNYPSEWDTLDPTNYVHQGSDPGIIEKDENYLPPACNIDGEFGC